MSRIAIALLFSSLASGACKGKKDGPSCDDVGTAFLAISHRQLDDAPKDQLDSATKATVESHLPAMRDSMVLACKEGKWSAESRGCFTGAGDPKSMESCYETLSPEQQKVLDDGFSQPKD
jgi:hypothetical protein